MNELHSDPTISEINLLFNLTCAQVVDKVDLQELFHDDPELQHCVDYVMRTSDPLGGGSQSSAPTHSSASLQHLFRDSERMSLHEVIASGNDSFDTVKLQPIKDASQDSLLSTAKPDESLGPLVKSAPYLNDLSDPLDFDCDDLSSLDIDIRALASSLGADKTLVHVMVHLGGKHGCYSTLADGNGSACSKATWVQWARCVADGYNSVNPYHNSLHAADVVLTANAYLEDSGVLYLVSDNASKLSSWDGPRLALLVASAVHDLGHPARQNSFMLRTNHPLTVQFQGRRGGLLEELHVSLFLETIRAPGQDIFELFTRPQKNRIRAIVADLVLATDLSKHSEIVDNWVSKRDSDTAGDRGRPTKIPGWSVDLNLDSFYLLRGSPDVNSFLQLVIKAADVSNPAKDTSLYFFWTDRILAEFYAQGDEEKNQGLPITCVPQCDRSKPSVPAGQKGFIRFTVQPVFAALSDFSSAVLSALGPEQRSGHSSGAPCGLNVPLNNVERHFDFWSRLEGVVDPAVILASPFVSDLPISDLQLGGTSLQGVNRRLSQGPQTEKTSSYNVGSDSPRPAATDSWDAERLEEKGGEKGDPLNPHHPSVPATWTNRPGSGLIVSPSESDKFLTSSRLPASGSTSKFAAVLLEDVEQWEKKLLGTSLALPTLPASESTSKFAAVLQEDVEQWEKKLLGTSLALPTLPASGSENRGNAESPPPDVLSDGWSTRFSSVYNTVYYFHAMTGMSSWVRPPAVEAREVLFSDGLAAEGKPRKVRTAAANWALLRLVLRVQSAFKSSHTRRVPTFASTDIRLKGYLSFLPAMLAQQLIDTADPDRRQSLANSRAGEHLFPNAQNLHGVVFFADLSGFTKLTERLAVQPHGAELLCDELDSVFTLILDEVDRWGGDCVKFAGDALLCCWPVTGSLSAGDLRTRLELAAARAIRCSIRVHELIWAHPPVSGVKLTLHAGMGAGPMTACILGGANSSFEYVIAGAPLAQLGLAEPAARPGETVMSPECAALVANVADLEEITGVSKATGYFRLRGLVRGAVDVALPLVKLSAQTFERLAPCHLSDMAPFIPPSIVEKLDSLSFFLTGKQQAGPSSSGVSASGSFMQQPSGADKAEMREVTTLFVNVLGVDLSLDLDHSQRVFDEVQRCTFVFGGTVNKLLVDDKGTLVVIVFGLPPHVHRDTPSRAVASALLLIDHLYGMPSPNATSECISCHIGITTARTFCGVIGSRMRREFTVMGDSINLAARLMAACSSVVLMPEDITAGEEQARGPKISNTFTRSTAIGPNGMKHPLVLMDAATARATSSDVVSIQLSDMMVKGKAKLVQVFHPWRFVDDKDRNWKQRTASPYSVAEVNFAGRGPRANRDALGRAVKAMSRQTCQVCVVTGGAQVGKHTLVEWLRFLCPPNRLIVAGSTPSTRDQNLIEEGKLKQLAMFIAFRGPLMTMLYHLQVSGLCHSTSSASSPPARKQSIRRSGLGSFVAPSERTVEGPDSVDVMAVAMAVLPAVLHCDVPLLRFMFPERGVSAPCQPTVPESPMSPRSKTAEIHRLKRLLVALFTTGSALASLPLPGSSAPPSGQGGAAEDDGSSSVAACDDHEMKIGLPFNYLILLSHGERTMDPESWILLGALRDVATGRRTGRVTLDPSTRQPIVGPRRQSAVSALPPCREDAPQGAVRAAGHPSVESMICEYAVQGGKPLVCLVSQALRSTMGVPVQYLDLLVDAAASKSLIEVQPLDQHDAREFLRHVMANKVATMSLAVALPPKSRRDYNAQVAAVAQAAADASEGAMVLAAAGDLAAVHGHVPLEVDDCIESIVDAYCCGEPVVIEEIVEELFDDLAVFLQVRSKTGGSGGAGPADIIGVAARPGFNLEEMPLSQRTTLRALGRFHAALGDRPQHWALVARLAASFATHFSSDMLKRLVAVSFGEELAVDVEHILASMDLDLGLLEGKPPPPWMLDPSVHPGCTSSYKFRSKLLAQVLRSTLLHSQLEAIAAASVRFSPKVRASCVCKPVLRVLVTRRPSTEGVPLQPLRLSSGAAE